MPSRQPQEYPLPVEQIRARYYPNLRNQTYLDHAGCTVYPSLLLDRIHNELMVQLLGNPHSQSLPSKNTELLVAETRLKVLELFHADPAEYDVAFLLNATHAVKTVCALMCDNFASFNYYYNIHCHTSLIGIREHAAVWKPFTDIAELAQLQPHTDSPALVSWTGQSNFNGERFPLEWNSEVKRHSRWYSLFDAASLSTTSPPNLSVDSPDFVAVSFYKIFGLPDIGGLIFKKDTAGELIHNKKYFGGGTVDALSATSSFSRHSRQLHTVLEDGTIPFHSITALSLAIDVHHELYGGFDNVAAYTARLRSYAVSKLNELKYPGYDTPMVKIHQKSANCGPIIALSLLDRSGNHVGYYGFEKISSLQNIAVRTGTLCNIGGIQTFLNRTSAEIERDYNEGHKCGDALDIMHSKPTGAIRVSFGAMTLRSEIDTLVKSISEYLLNDHEEVKHVATQKILIKQLAIYPIKSCPGYSIPEGTKWEVSEQGLRYDRQFVLLDLLEGKPLLLKFNPKMSMLRPSVDLGKGTMRIENAETGKSLEISLDPKNYSCKTIGSFNAIVDSDVSHFFMDYLGVACTLATSTRQMQSKSAFLVVNLTSLKEFTLDMGLISRFRANVVVESPEPFTEDSWESLVDESSQLDLVKLCNCDRCHMVTITDKGTRDPTLLLDLVKKRKRQDKVYFGINMNVTSLGEGWLRVSDEMRIR